MKYGPEITIVVATILIVAILTWSFHQVMTASAGPEINAPSCSCTPDKGDDCEIRLFEGPNTRAQCALWNKDERGKGSSCCVVVNLKGPSIRDQGPTRRTRGLEEPQPERPNQDSDESIAQGER